MSERQGTVLRGAIKRRTKMGMREGKRALAVVDRMETETVARKLFWAWWGRRGPIRFEDQDVETWFRVARAAQRMGARSTRK